MIVKYWFRNSDVGTKGPFQCDKEEIKQIIKHFQDMWLRVELPTGQKWFYAKYINGWKKIA